MQFTDETTWEMAFDEPGVTGLAGDPATLDRLTGLLGRAAEELDHLLAEARDGAGGCPVYLEAASSAVHLALVELRSCELDPLLRDERCPGS
jgi:hypothetical protein